MSRDLEALRRARICLTSQGLSVMTASTLDEALQLWDKTTFGVVFLDMRSSSIASGRLLDLFEQFFHENRSMDAK